MASTDKCVVAVSSARNLQSTSVIRTLAKIPSFHLRVMVEDPNDKCIQALKASYPMIELCTASFDDQDSLVKFTRGAKIVFGVTPYKSIWLRDMSEQPDGEFTHGKNLVDAAVKNKVENYGADYDSLALSIRCSSADNINEGTHGKYSHVYMFDNKNRVEQYISSLASCLPAVFIYPGFFYDTIMKMVTDKRDAQGRMIFSSPLRPTNKLPLVDPRADIGPTVQYVLENFDEVCGEAIDVAGGYYTIHQVIEAFTKVTGIPATYSQIPLSDLKDEQKRDLIGYISEYGFFFRRIDFMTRNKDIPHLFASPEEFWQMSKFGKKSYY
ncbi:hypothetical protein EV182_000081 [Spiromyces aspiralis]|uniref:Uncharacterized protein n=1 Tax=Spiromyces aspiralis TaxID=68401 RepID=A0ACC1HHP8_9FUNG|nr:hypothetical protein EV182_000081 [Spiromyces aspiralis]